MNSLAALFSFQGTDRPGATRRTSGAPVKRRNLHLTKNRDTLSRFFSLRGPGVTASFLVDRPPASVFKKIVSREGNEMIRAGALEVKKRREWWDQALERPLEKPRTI